MGWIEAWSHWLQTDETLRSSSVWGIEILWWGRLGKFLAFAAGFVVLLDLIKDERLRAITDRSRVALQQENSKIARAFASVAVGVILAGAVLLAMRHPVDTSGELPGEAPTNPYVILVIGVGVPLAFAAWVITRRTLMWLFVNDRTAAAVRILSLMLFVVGFFLDLLAS